MLTLFNAEKQRVPIKAWVTSADDLDATCLEQALNLASLPFAFRHIALMPDTHSGYGMPIGGVFASSDVVIPNAVGVDIGCGMGFARHNREKIMRRVQEIVVQGLNRHAGVKDVNISQEVSAHHNYAAHERHFGQDVWVHRKGAIRALQGEPGIIPGAMGSASYLVEGLGNAESFCSASHGAGRVMGRKEAIRAFGLDEILAHFEAERVVLGKRRKSDTAEEYYKAYKNIEDVMANQADLAKPVLKVKTVAVIKG
ncbi:MAG: RtcB family protein [Limnochordia bacterium]|jgi:RNA-splicing ligase RtcB|nr:RtcB family protein [Limnochordia bacterium]